MPRYIHFSLDDVIDTLHSLKKCESTYHSMFENEVLSFLRRLHEKWGLCVSLYCFWENDDFCLSDVSDAFRDEMAANSAWLRFGYHTVSPQDKTADYSRYSDFCNAMLKMTGCEKCIDTFPRLHGFGGIIQDVTAISAQHIPHGVTGLLTADNRDYHPLSYYLDEGAQNKLNDNGYLYDSDMHISFIPTSFRFDDYRKVRTLRKAHLGDDVVVVFTHEWLLTGGGGEGKRCLLDKIRGSEAERDKRAIKRAIEGTMRYYVRRGYEAAFPQDIAAGTEAGNHA